ncbi:MAG: hypothetical protein GY859_10175, partial [Desulfobacterales bacterium]|nr:hypothetical protein [Desulfobacterales bacterium]
GGIGVSADRIRAFTTDIGFDGYFETSAKAGDNIESLTKAIREAIDWEMLPEVSSTKLFKDIKTFLIDEKKTGHLLATADDLYHAFLKTPLAKTHESNDDLRPEFNTCIGRVESRGLIQRFSFGNLVLLQPELLDAYASAMVNAAREEPDGLGCIAEEDARAGRFRLDKDERIADREQEKLLLIGAIEEMLRHEIALREPSDHGPYLVFPTQLTRERPDLPDPEGKTVVFGFEGPVLNIYATLIVRLAHGDVFLKTALWKNAATYVAKVGGSCGVVLREFGEGGGELILFFDEKASEETRFQFEEYVHTHLQRRALPETISRRRIFVCPGCDTPISDMAAVKRRERGFDWISCNVCDTRISLLDREERLKAPGPSLVPEMDRAADERRALETAASMLQGKIETNDFDVFLCHNTEDKPV